MQAHGEQIAHKLYAMNLVSQKFCSANPEPCRHALGKILIESFFTALESETHIGGSAGGFYAPH